MNIYITDGNTRPALAITRSLGSKGHHIYVGSTIAQSIASASNKCFSAAVYPDPVQNSSEFIESLLDQIAKLNIDILIPVTDITTMLILENESRFKEVCKLGCSNYRTVERVANKLEITNLASQLEIPIPESYTVKSKTNLHDIQHGIPYPVVIKPARSRIKTDTGWIYTTVTYANNTDELTEILQAKNPLEFPIILQERIEGPGIGIFACYNQGQLTGIFSHQRIREKPPSGGVSVLRESIPPNPLAAAYSKTLLQTLNWNGVAMVEFKLDNRDNTPKLMEINGRFWGSLQLAIDAGVDFPYLLLQAIENQPISPVLDYKHGIRTRWLLGDLDVLLMLFFKKRKSLNLPESYPGRFKSLLVFFKLFGKNLRYEVLSLRDIKPFLRELRQYLNI